MKNEVSLLDDYCVEPLLQENLDALIALIISRDAVSVSALPPRFCSVAS